jgi:subtilase family serine protease
VIWPASDPLVTAVGGTQMHLDAKGNRTAPDNVWNDAPVGINAAAGGGVSSIFGKPDFQEDVTTQGDARGIPDISLSAAVDGGAVVYYSFTKPAGGTPWHIFGGTSEASPLFAGVVAIADQLAGHRLGNINDRLYELSDEAAHNGIVDITQGNINYKQVNSDKTTVSITGPSAGPGYDLASGLGTVNAKRFVPALADRELS